MQLCTAAYSYSLAMLFFAAVRASLYNPSAWFTFTSPGFLRALSSWVGFSVSMLRVLGPPTRRTGLCPFAGWGGLLFDARHRKSDLARQSAQKPRGGEGGEGGGKVEFLEAERFWILRRLSCDFLVQAIFVESLFFLAVAPFGDIIIILGVFRCLSSSLSILAGCKSATLCLLFPWMPTFLRSPSFSHLPLVSP